MTLTIELPDSLEAALREQANAEGLSEAGYIRRVLERDLTTSTAGETNADGEKMTRSQLAGQRIRELRKGATLGGIAIRELIEEGRE
jgi:hypothetical protein